METEIFAPMASHVMPVNDLEEHIASQKCRCQPRLKTLRDDDMCVTGHVWVHHAWDAREARESIEERVHLPTLIAETFGGSRSEARRMLSQGGVKLNGDYITQPDAPAGALNGTLTVGNRQSVELEDGQPTNKPVF